jgi:hypothetical protein
VLTRRERDRRLAVAVLDQLESLTLPPPPGDVGTARRVVRAIAELAGQLRPLIDQATRSTARRNPPTWLPLVDRYTTHATLEVARWAPYVTMYAGSWTPDHAERFRGYVVLLEDARQTAILRVRAALLRRGVPQPAPPNPEPAGGPAGPGGPSGPMPSSGAFDPAAAPVPPQPSTPPSAMPASPMPASPMPAPPSQAGPPPGSPVQPPLLGVVYPAPAPSPWPPRPEYVQAPARTPFGSPVPPQPAGRPIVRPAPPVPPAPSRAEAPPLPPPTPDAWPPTDVDSVAMDSAATDGADMDSADMDGAGDRDDRDDGDHPIPPTAGPPGT